MTEPGLRPKILIVDDRPQNLFALEKLLTTLDADIIQAASGVEALGLTLEHDFCLAIVDIQMPEMDGYELVELLRGNLSTSTLPVIFVSAIYSDEYHHRKGYDAGAVDFLSKPFVPQILLSKVKVFLDLYRQRVTLEELINELNTKNEALVRVTGELQTANMALSKRALQLEASNQMGQQVTSVLELDELLAAVVKAIQTNFGYYFVGVWLLNEDKDKLILQAGLGRDGSRQLTPETFIEPHGPSSIARVMQSGQAYRVDDVKTDATFLALDALAETCSEIALPLHVGPEMIGVLDIRSDRRASFGLEDQRVLQTLTNQIAIAIRNARLYELEKKLNQDKDKFFSIISHDLRGPFNSLLGNAQLMMEMIDQLSPQDIQEMSGSIYNQAKAAHILLENLLTWSQLQRGRIDYDPGPVDLHRLAANTVTLLQETALRKQIRLEQTIEESLFIYADIYMVDTVIRNLTGNALKFTPAGGQVTLSARQNDCASNHEGAGWVEVSIKDTGVGISPEDIDKLFKIEVHHTTRGTAQEKGTGLGLILCQEMVEKNGGRIWVESELNQGTTVKFTVPLTDLSSAAIK